MSKEIKQSVDPNSAAFKAGVQAGLNSSEYTENWTAGNELGQELNEEAETEAPVGNDHDREASVPLFLRDSLEGKKGNAQDEKDETEE